MLMNQTLDKLDALGLRRTNALPGGRVPARRENTEVPYARSVASGKGSSGCPRVRPADW
jgi:hypothetical protein